MFELYVRCPTTGEPVYAGFQSGADDGIVPRISMENSVCAACGRRHRWEATSVWSAIPVTLPSEETPSLEIAPSEPAVDETPPMQEAWSNVA